MSEDMGEFETIEPNWVQLFKYAEQLVSDAEGIDGRDLVIEMLQFGKRLEEHRNRREYVFTSPWIDENEEDSRTHRIVAYRRPLDQSPYGEGRRYVTHMEFQDGDCLSGHYDLTYDKAIADAVERYARTGHQARLEYLRSKDAV